MTRERVEDKQREGGGGVMTRSFQESTGSLAWRLKQEQFRAERLERERAVVAAQENAQAASARDEGARQDGATGA